MTASRGYFHGVTPKALARREARKAHNPRYKTGKLDGWQMNAKQRRVDLERLVRYRAGRSLDLGDEIAWAKVIANMLRVLENQVSDHAVHREANWLRLPRLNPTIVTVAVREIAGKAWGRYLLYTPREAGTLLGVTMMERDRAEILKLEAIDEPREDRRRRQFRENKRMQRAAHAAPKGPTKKMMCEGLKVSRPTLDKWIREGRVDPETGELVDFTLRVHTSIYEVEDLRTENVKSPEVVPA